MYLYIKFKIKNLYDFTQQFSILCNIRYYNGSVFNILNILIYLLIFLNEIVNEIVKCK